MKLISKVILIVAGVVILALAIYLIFFANKNDSAMPGSDRDAHGCIGSAGYSWCEAKQKCLRSWEEECK